MISRLIDREKFQPKLELQAGTSSYHVLYVYEYIWYVEVPGSPAAYECVRTLCDVHIAYLGGMFLFVVVVAAAVDAVVFTLLRTS